MIMPTHVCVCVLPAPRPHTPVMMASSTVLCVFAPVFVFVRVAVCWLAADVYSLWKTTLCSCADAFCERARSSVFYHSLRIHMESDLRWLNQCIEGMNMV